MTLRIFLICLFIISVAAFIAVTAPAGGSPAGVAASGGAFPTIAEDHGGLSIAAEQLRIDAALAEAARLKAEIDAANAWKVTRYGRTGVDWDGIAQCETGSDWQHQTRYDGGLGILHAAWIEFGGRDFAEYGSQATREEQIIVAERLHDEHGLSGWGCKAYG